jgi:hypothetical protein
MTHIFARKYLHHLVFYAHSTLMDNRNLTNMEFRGKNNSRMIFAYISDYYFYIGLEADEFHSVFSLRRKIRTLQYFRSNILAHLHEIFAWNFLCVQGNVWEHQMNQSNILLSLLGK